MLLNTTRTLKIVQNISFFDKEDNMTELDAINVMLRAIGSSPVNSITSAHPDVANARATLKRHRAKAQKRGWWFNIDYNTLLYPDSLNEIQIPEEILSVVFEDRFLVKRGIKIYNSLDNTYKFEESITAKRTVRNLPWEELPESMKEYIINVATADFIRDEIEDRAKAQDYQEEAGRSLINVHKEDLEASQFNAFQKQRVMNARAGVRPYSRSHNRFLGGPYES